VRYDCPSCGCLATEDATFCDGCGTPIKRRDWLATLKTVVVAGGILFLLAVLSTWLVRNPSGPPAQVASMSLEVSGEDQAPTVGSRSAAPAPPAPSDAGKWRGCPTVSQTDDSKGYVASLDAENTVGAFLDTNLRPTLVIRCEQGEVSLHIFTGTPAQVEWGGGKTVRYCIDETTVVTEKWSESEDHRALGIWSSTRSLPLAQRIARSQQLIFQFTPFRGRVATIVFKTLGLAPHLDKIIQAQGTTRRGK
jgi:hypothetical protein